MCPPQQLALFFCLFCPAHLRRCSTRTRQECESTTARLAQPVVRLAFNSKISLVSDRKRFQLSHLISKEMGRLCGGCRLPAALQRPEVSEEEKQDATASLSCYYKEAQSAARSRGGGLSRPSELLACFHITLPLKRLAVNTMTLTLKGRSVCHSGVWIV